MPAQLDVPSTYPGEADLCEPPRIPHRLAVEVHDADLTDGRLLERVLLPGLLVLQVLSTVQMTQHQSQLSVAIAPDQQGFGATSHRHHYITSEVSHMTCDLLRHIIQACAIQTTYGILTMYARARFWIPCSSTRLRSTVRSERADTQEMILSHPCNADAGDDSCHTPAVLVPQLPSTWSRNVNCHCTAVMTALQVVHGITTQDVNLLLHLP